MNYPMPYRLPAMLGEQYMLRHVMDETNDVIIYDAEHKDIRRDVIIESMRPSSMRDDVKIELFLESARLRSSIKFNTLAASLELLFIDDCWHFISERIKGDSFNLLLSQGDLLNSHQICSLMRQICTLCIYLDIEGIASRKFALDEIYLSNGSFRMNNPACAGVRTRNASRGYITTAATALVKFLDTHSYLADGVNMILDRMQFEESWYTLSALTYSNELMQMQLRIMAKEHEYNVS